MFIFLREKKKTPNSLIRQQENNLSIKLVERLKSKKKKNNLIDQCLIFL